MRLKPLSEQVLVITGASSGIGLTTARLAAERGARLVLSSRNADVLNQVVSAINDRHGQVAIAVPADVANEAELRRVAEAATEHFGGFDTWINNAGISIYGRLAEVPEEDHRRLFETNFWGVVHGARIAVEHFSARAAERQGQGFALINVGSTLSDRAIPLQGMYCASKHAVKGFTDALRMELEEAGLPISVTLIKPAAIDTPYRQHAKNYMAHEPMNPPPVYAPETVARGILHCAEHPRRDLFIGSGGAQLSLLGTLLPRIVDWVMEKVMVPIQQGDRPSAPREENALYQPGADGEERGGYGEHGMVREHSYYTQAAMHPMRTVAALAGAGLLIAGLVAVARQQNGSGGSASRLRSYFGGSSNGH